MLPNVYSPPLIAIKNQKDARHNALQTPGEPLPDIIVCWSWFAPKQNRRAGQVLM